MCLRSAGFATAGGIDLERRVEHLVVHPDRLWMIRSEPSRVVQRAGRAVGRELEVIETSVRAGGAIEPRLIGFGLLSLAGESVLGELGKRIEERFEVWLADEGRAVTGAVQHRGNRRCIDGQRHAVHPHPVGARMLAGQHRRA